jgi:hypothetical protein
LQGEHEAGIVGDALDDFRKTSAPFEHGGVAGRGADVPRKTLGALDLDCQPAALQRGAGRRQERACDVDAPIAQAALFGVRELTEFEPRAPLAAGG